MMRMNNVTIKNNMIKTDYLLSKYATLNKNLIRLDQSNDDNDLRNPFFIDIDRIIYSLAYVRYIDKTQVFSINDNDFISKRMIHVQLVSKIGRTIGRALNLNEDLIEAIALGHDIGHVPFGHLGESILNDLSLKYHEGYFNHNIQSVRTFMTLEKKGRGNNLSIQVLDGIMCHNGLLTADNYQPISKSIDTFLAEYKNSYQIMNFNQQLIPMTLEGCVVRLADIIGYLGRDIEDAIILGIIQEQDLPVNITEVLGSTNTQIINTIVSDIIHNSYGKSYIKLSSKVFDAMLALKDFNKHHIYMKANSKQQIENINKMFNSLFLVYLDHIKNCDYQSDIYRVFLDNMDSDYLKANSDVRKVIDFIAGMTDGFFMNQYQKYCNKIGN